MKKNLARSIVLGLLCAGAVSGSAWAAVNTITVDDTNPNTVIELTDPSSLPEGLAVLSIEGSSEKNIAINDRSQDYGGINHPQVIFDKVFLVGIDNNSIGTVNLTGKRTSVDIDGEESTYDWITINGDDSATALHVFNNNKGTINVLNSIIFDNYKLNNFANINFKDRVDLELDSYYDLDATTVEQLQKEIVIFNALGATLIAEKEIVTDSVGNTTIIKNDGDMTVNGKVTIYDWLAPNAIVGQRPTIINTGNLDMNGGLDAWMEGPSANDWYRSVNNSGKMTIDKYLLIGVGVDENGIEGAKDYSDFYAIDNTGELNLTNMSRTAYYADYGPEYESWEDPSQIYGDINHGANAITNISLGDDSIGNGFVAAIANSNIHGSNDKFNMILKYNSYWNPHNQEGEVEGINQQGGNIYLNVDRINPDVFDGYYYKRAEELSWNTGFNKANYSTLTLKNFKSNGEGWIGITTDLANNVGDKLILTGDSVPNTINVGILNKNDNNGVAITPDDNKSVTIVEAPSAIAANMKVNTQLGFYDQTTREVYKANIVEDIDGATKYWNFTGWGEGKKLDVKEEPNKDAPDTYFQTIETEETIKRVNDIRTDPSEVGVWMRMMKGDTKIRNYSYDFNIISGGYDWHKENRAGKLFYGFGLSYSTNDCDDKIIGDTKNLSYNLYGSWLGRERNDYVDVILKYGTMDKSYAGIAEHGLFVSGDYDKKMYAISTKYGRRIDRGNGVYIEPFASLSYAKTNSANYTDSLGVKIHSAGATSKIASLGAQVGKKVDKLDFFGKFEYVHDFGGKLTVSVPGTDEKATEDMGGSWYKVSIGAARKINENNSFYLDLEKDFGNKVKRPYAIGFGYRYTF